jgi:hypothetical protein
MTYQGHENLYAESIEIESIKIINSIKPIHTLTWFIQKYVNGLPENIRQKFFDMTVSEFMATPESFYDNDIVTTLKPSVELELASATLLTGRKKYS